MGRYIILLENFNFLSFSCCGNANFSGKVNHVVMAASEKIKVRRLTKNAISISVA
jgi:hypothetical protein